MDNNIHSIGLLNPDSIIETSFEEEPARYLPPEEILTTVARLQSQNQGLDISQQELTRLIRQMRESIAPKIETMDGLVETLEKKMESKANQQSPKPSSTTVITCSRFMHLLAHNSNNQKHLGELSIIFTSLVAENALSSEIINYMLLNFTLSYESLSRTDNLNILLVRKALCICHKYKLLGRKPAEEQRNACMNSFKLMAYLLYMGNSPVKQESSIVNQLVRCPYEISNILLQFRYGYPMNQVFHCSRNFKNFTFALVDHILFQALISMFLNPDHELIREQVYTVLLNIVKYDPTLLSIKSLLKKLEIFEESEYTKDKWKQIFNLLKLTLHSSADPYDERSERQSLNLTKKSYIQMVFSQPHVKSIKIKFKSYRLFEELLIGKLMNNQESQIWVCCRHLDRNNFMVSLLRFKKSIPVEIKKIDVVWEPLDERVLRIKFDKEKIVFDFEGGSKIDIMNIEPTSFVVGDMNNQIGCYVCELTACKIRYEKAEDDDFLENYTNSPDILPKDSYRQVSFKLKKSLVFLLKKMGDLDLFLLIVSHLIKKVTDKEKLEAMITQLFNFLQALVSVKKVRGVELTKDEKEKRICNVVCLAWLSSRQKHPATVIIHLLRLLTMRGTEDMKDQLQVLCNFGQWKEIPHKQHQILVDKTNEVFNRMQENYDVKLNFLKKILLDLMVFYRNIQVEKEKTQEEYLKNISQVMEMVAYQLLKDRNAQRLFIWLDFIIFMAKSLYLLVDRTCENELSNIAMGFQFAKLSLQILKEARNLHIKIDKLKKQKEKQRKQSPQKMPSRSPKRMNSMADDQNITLKLQEIYFRLSQVLYILKNQLLFTSEQSLKYCDWQNKHQMEYTREDKIIELCEMVEVSCVCFNFKSLEYFGLVTFQYFTASKAEIYWLINFVEMKEDERAIQYLKMGPIHVSLEDPNLISKIIARSFQIKDGKNLIKLPTEFIQNLCSANVEMLNNLFISLYLKAKEANKSETLSHDLEQVYENILYYIVKLPNFLYTNSHAIRKQLYQLQRKRKTLKTVENHLLLKQFLRQGFQVMNSVKGKNKKYTSAIEGFSFQNLEKEVLPGVQSDVVTSEGLGYCEIGQQQVREALQQVRNLSENKLDLGTFYCLNVGSEDYEEQSKAMKDNFGINIDSILKLLEEREIDRKISQLQNSIFFLEKHIFEFSSMILDTYFFPQVIAINPPRCGRKRSMKMRETKVKEESEQELRDFLHERRIFMFKVENMWANVEKKNKYFWQVFFQEENKHQSVDVSCNPLKMRTITRVDNQKRQIELPKNLSVSTLIKVSISGDSEMEQTQEGGSESSTFQKAVMYEVDVGDNEDKSNQKTTKKRDNQFSVLWVTTNKIYQGTITCQNDCIHFVEHYPDESYYDHICANENERRTNYQIQKDKKSFKIKINSNSIIIPKRYLFYEIAIEIYSLNRTYFLCFRKANNRDKFAKIYNDLRGNIVDSRRHKEIVEMYKNRWLCGDISNFTYLMHLNDLGGRSFDDMSQYYVFPWTVTNFTTTKLNGEFFCDHKNFRDLGKPIGAINPKRLEQIYERYRESQKFNQTEGFLFGSFYSNPAIVSNFLVRVEPFSTHHYLLQSKSFDFADRIFYSFSNQYSSSYSNFGDYKQLVPQFYFYPEFLRNRSKYDFGSRQNKKIVHNVDLPEWARRSNNLFKVEEKFTFILRRCLDSPYVTTHLSKWIDLIFGAYSQKERALEKSNLFSPSVYKDQLKKNTTKKKYDSKQSLFIYYKQFGQAPRELFDTEHEPNNLDLKVRGFRKEFIDPTTDKILDNKPSSNNSAKLYYSGPYLFYSLRKELTIVDLTEQANPKTQCPMDSQIDALVHFKCEGDKQTNQSKTASLILYVMMGRLMIRQISTRLMRKGLQIGTEVETEILSYGQNVILTALEQQGLIIMSLGSNIRIYKLTVQSRSSGVEKSKRNSYPLNSRSMVCLQLLSEFIQHRAQIEQLELLASHGLMVSIDSTRKTYIFKIFNCDVEILQTIKMRKMSFCESILQCQLHEMGYVILFTSAGNIHMYNLMGDLVVLLTSDELRELKLLGQNQKIMGFQIWNHETSQLLLSVNTGQLIRIDLFLHEDYEVFTPAEKKKEELEGKLLHQTKIYNIGRHWMLVGESGNSVYRIQSSDYGKALKRSKDFNKKFPQ